MKRFGLALALLSGCAVGDDLPGGPDQYRYTCRLLTSCDSRLEVSKVDVCGALEEVRGWSAEWTHACSAIAGKVRVMSGECQQVICGSVCQSADGDGADECLPAEEI